MKKLTFVGLVAFAMNALAAAPAPTLEAQQFDKPGKKVEKKDDKKDEKDSKKHEKKGEKSDDPKK